MKKKTEKDVIVKLYEESLNDIIWTHKIQATLLDEYTKMNKRLETAKEVIVGLSGFVSVVSIYFNWIIIAIISSGLSCVAVIVDGIFRISNYEEKINVTKQNVNELWLMKKQLSHNKEYLKSDIITWREGKLKLEQATEQRKEIYSKLETAPNRIIEKAKSKLLERKDEEINKEFFQESV